MTNGDAGTKTVNAYAKNATFKDLTGHITDEIKTNEEGVAEFRCPAGSLSIWAQV
jgi:alpha-amylase